MGDKKVKNKSQPDHEDLFPRPPDPEPTWSDQDIVDRFISGGTITSPYGLRARGMHYGIDIVGYPLVRAGVTGTVTDVVWGYGTYNTVKISIDAMPGFTLEMMHFDPIFVSKGDRVTPWTPVGYMGGWGPTGPDDYTPHLHLQIRNPSGVLVDPIRGFDWTSILFPPGIPPLMFPPLPPSRARWIAPTMSGGNAG